MSFQFPERGVATREADPRHLLALALVSGVTLPPLAGLRVLDLRCGHGARLAAFAEAWPTASCLGVDPDPALIERARARSAGVFEVGELEQIEGTWDVIVAWEGPSDRPPADRPAWWSALADRLNPGGLAVVRFAALPGWHMLGAVREMALYHARRQRRRVEDAGVEIVTVMRDLLEGEKLPWEGWLGLVGEAVAADPEVAPWLLAAELHAFALHEAVDEAGAAGLGYVCDARLPSNSRATLPASLQAFVVDELQRSSDRVRGEQILDYARNQHVRAPIFVKGAPPVSHHLAVDAVEDLLVGVGDDRPQRWATEPQAAPAESVLREADTPPTAAAVVDQVRAAGGWLDWPTIRAAIAGSDDEVKIGVVVAAELGLVDLRVPPPSD